MNETKFIELASKWLDGSLSDTESNELQAELGRSLDRRNEFVDLCGLDADLRLMNELRTSTLPLSESDLSTQSKASSIASESVSLRSEISMQSSPPNRWFTKRTSPWWIAEQS